MWVDRFAWEEVAGGVDLGVVFEKEGLVVGGGCLEYARPRAGKVSEDVCGVYVDFAIGSECFEFG